MKNLFKKPTYAFLFLGALLISLTFSSCADNNEYATQIQKADALFKSEKYKEAKIMYENALELKKEEVHPTQQIKKIDELLLKKIEHNYSNKIKDADAFFSNKEYTKAKNAYVDASNIKINEKYPKTKINEITIATAKIKAAKAKPYHLITGSYALKTNATEFQKSLKSKGRKSTIIRSRNGNYLISLHSFETITKAYNYRITLKNDFDASIWVYRVNIK